MSQSKCPESDCSDIDVEYCSDEGKGHLSEDSESDKEMDDEDSESDKEMDDEDSESNKEMDDEDSESDKEMDDEDSESDKEMDDEPSSSTNNKLRDHPSLTLYKPNPAEKKILAALVVELNHEVPPQHNIESSAGTRCPNASEKKRFAAHPSMKKGKFSTQECNIIKRNWQEFCEKHGWDPKRPYVFMQMRYQNKDCHVDRLNRKKFVQFLAKDLSNRTLYSVCQAFRLILYPHKTSRYSKKEDDIIREFTAGHEKVENKRYCADLALILNRTRPSVWRRYQVLIGKNTRKNRPKNHKNSSKKSSL